MKRKWIAALAAGVFSIVLTSCAPPRIHVAASSAAPAAQSAEAGYESASAYGGLSLPDSAEREPQWNTEEYSAKTENGFHEVMRSPRSTFAADVDTASYANIRRKVLEGNLPEPDAVRIEEMLNYFSYDYPAPRAGEPFSITMELADCSWSQNRLLLIGLQAEQPQTQSLPPSNLVFLMDVSGSMEDADKLPLMKRAFLLLADQLRAEDTVSIVTYASDDRVVLDGVSGADKTTLMSAIENLTAGGGTAGAQGIQSAYDLARKHFISGANNRVIIGTDGDLNIGITSEGDLKRLVERERESGVFLSVMGFGTGNIKDNKMQTLADFGNGNYSYIDDVAEARKVLIEEMGGTLFTVAKDVKLQVEFNPQRVAQYRLIGYENRLLNSEDFADDTKDGGEIGAGHSMSALYEIVEAQGAADSGLKYQQTTPTGSDEYLTLSVRSKQPDALRSTLIEYPLAQSTSGMSSNLLFASAVAETGMLLMDSEYAGNSSYANVRQRLAQDADLMQDPYKQEFAMMVQALVKLSGESDQPERARRWENLWDTLEP